MMWNYIVTSTDEEGGGRRERGREQTRERRKGWGVRMEEEREGMRMRERR